MGKDRICNFRVALQGVGSDRELSAGAMTLKEGKGWSNDENFTRVRMYPQNRYAEKLCHGYDYIEIINGVVKRKRYKIILDI